MPLRKGSATAVTRCASARSSSAALFAVQTRTDGDVMLTGLPLPTSTVMRREFKTLDS